MRYWKEIQLKDGRECLLRSAVLEDAEDMMHCAMKTHAETEFLTGYPDEDTRQPELERSYLVLRENSRDAVELCAVADDRIVASAGFEPVGSYEKLRHRALFCLSVEKRYWRQGIGRALTEACIELAGMAGYYQMELEVVAANEAAVRLYHSVGFREFGRNPRGLLTREGQWQETVLMLLKLR